MTVPMYNTLTDYRGNVSDVNSLLYSVRDAVTIVNPFFVILIGIFLVFTISSYYAQIKLVGNQRFLNSMLAGSFGAFLISMLFSFAELVTALHTFTFIAISVLSLALIIFYRE